MKKTAWNVTPRRFVLLAVLCLVFAAGPARAIVSGGDIWSEILSEGGKIAEIGYAVTHEKAWAYGYAAVLWNESEAYDTTLVGDPDLASVDVSRSMGFVGRAKATAWARKSTNEIYTYTKRKRAGVAKAYAGIGRNYRTSGSKSGWIWSKILNLVFDPTDPEIPDRLDYNIDLIDPSGQRKPLLHVSGNMVFDPDNNDWNLRIQDSSGILSVGSFTKTVEDTPEGRHVTFALTNPVDYQIAVDTPWQEGSEFTIITQTTLQPIPEPTTGFLFLTGVVGIVVHWRRVRSHPSGERASR